MRLHVLGAGAAGTALGRALVRADWEVGSVACRTEARARERVALVGAGSAAALDGWSGPRGDTAALALVSVPDRHIAATARDLARLSWPPGSVALHLSGVVEVEALAPLRARGVAVGGLHPLKSFVDPEVDATSLEGTVFALEGDAAALQAAQVLVTDLRGRDFVLRPGSRAAWHAAASHAANHLVALADQALDLMVMAGLDRGAARGALVPLLSGTVSNLARHAPEEALTGPLVRGDLYALTRHIEALADADPDVDRAYRALARRALTLARRSERIDAETARAIEEIVDP